MENVLYPEERKWISPLTHLGEAMTELKNLVRLHKESLIVDNSNQQAVRIKTEVDDEEHQKEEPYASDTDTRFGPDATNVDRPFMNRDACRFDDDQTDPETEADPERLKEEIERAKRHQWSVSDELCETAVEQVKGPDFFSLKVKKDKKKGRGRKKVNKEEDNEDEENDTSAPNKENGDPVLDVALYENYNYGNLSLVSAHQYDQEEDLILDLLNPGSVNIPEALVASDDDDDLLAYDNDIDNYPNWAGKYDTCREKYREILGSDVEDSDSEENLFKFSDEEDNMPLNSDDPVPGPSNSKRKARGKGKKKAKALKKKSMLALTDVSNKPLGEPKSEQPEPVQNRCIKPSASDEFKRFVDWVFEQSKLRDREKKIEMRPELMERLNLSEKEVKDLQRYTGASQAAVKGEVFHDKPVMKSTLMPLLGPPIDISERSTLQSLTIFITHGDDPSSFPWKSVNVQQQMNDDFAHDQFLKRLEQQKADVTNSAIKGELVNKVDDFLIQVLVYQATDPDDLLPDEVKSYIEPKLAYELFVLGSQTVADLMNSIHCENDYVYLKDVPHPDQYVEDPGEFAKAKYPAKMMLIHNTIFANPAAAEMNYEKILNEWSTKGPEKRIGPFTSADWNKPLKDVSLRFGMPYMFTHLGGCEHTIVFTKARLLHLEDDHLKRNYPKINGTPRFKNVYCRVDNEYLARWAVLDFKEFPENPMLLCTECVLLYCYDKQKKKQGNFRLYPMIQMANIL